MGQKMCFGIICITCAVRMEHFNIFHYVSQKYAKSPIHFLQATRENHTAVVLF